MLTAILFSCLGILTGLWADDFEKLNMFLNFGILPLVFLGGVFYSTAHVSPIMRSITEFNPVFHMITGVRYGMTGHLEASFITGLYVLVPLTLGAFLLCVRLLKVGWNLRT